MDRLITTIEDRKEKITDKLSTEFSLNRISVEEYERLIKYSQTIETNKELQILEKLVEGYSAQGNNNHEISNNYGANDQIYNSNNGEREHVSILSSRTTKGVITGGNFVNILGDQKIIITENDLINNETTLNFVVLLGSVVIQVPDNVNVICKAIPILGDVSAADNISHGGGKKLIITGNVILGDIKVKVRKV